MNIPVNLFMWIMAFLPIAALLILMIKCGWGATEAAPVGLLITVVTGVAFYKADITDYQKCFCLISNLIHQNCSPYNDQYDQCHHT